MVPKSDARLFQATHSSESSRISPGLCEFFNTKYRRLLAIHLRKNPEILGIIVGVGSVWEADFIYKSFQHG
jgi:hypothetical protein